VFIESCKMLIQCCKTDWISEKQVMNITYKDSPVQKYSFGYSFDGKLMKINIFWLWCEVSFRVNFCVMCLRTKITVKTKNLH